MFVSVFFSFFEMTMQCILVAKIWNLSWGLLWLLAGRPWTCECNAMRVILTSWKKITDWIPHLHTESALIMLCSRYQNLTTNFRTTLLAYYGVNQWVYLLGPDILHGLEQRFQKLICIYKQGNNQAAGSLGLSATSQQYFSLTTNQPPASSTFLSEQISTSHQQPAKRSH
jgi:hypothetical protein